MLYTHKAVADGLVNGGLVTKDDSGAYHMDMAKAVDAMVANTTWCAYICSRWRELAAVRLAEGGHGARLGRLYRQPFPPQFLCGHNPGMIAALGNWMK